MDNRYLSRLAEKRADGEWVKRESFSELLDVCSTLKVVNERQNKILQRIKEDEVYELWKQ